jgi:hypothetical protein
MKVSDHRILIGPLLVLNKVSISERTNEMVAIKLAKCDEHINILGCPRRSPHSERQGTQETVRKRQGVECLDQLGEGILKRMTRGGHAWPRSSRAREGKLGSHPLPFTHEAVGVVVKLLLGDTLVRDAETVKDLPPAKVSKGNSLPKSVLGTQGPNNIMETGHGTVQSLSP